MKTDVLIIGCGIAGGTAALKLADARKQVILITRAEHSYESNTHYAQGGIIYTGKDDTPELLTKDILRAGDGFNNTESVKIVSEEGPKLVKEILIDYLGVPFDKEATGNLSVIREGAHSRARILHSADTTGRAIEKSLIKKIAAHENITLLTRHTAIDLLTPSHQSTNVQDKYTPQACVGAYVLDQKTLKVHRYIAKNTILATGGLGRIYLQTSNPEGSRGDGLAMAYRAGARVMNCEFVQFHPTTFYSQFAPNFLISEAIRGAGARLVNENGVPFMEKYAPEWKDLAPRDEVARSIHLEMLEEGKSNVFLDLKTYIPEDKIKRHFPEIHLQIKKYGIDISKDLVPIVPAAHYFCGGVWVDKHGQSNIENLYAVGEVSCTGVHGANRIGSSSLLEGLTWGYRAARHIIDNSNGQSLFPEENIPGWKIAGEDLPDLALIQQDMSAIQHLMWNYVGLIRTTMRLERAFSELRNLEIEIEQFYRATRVTDSLIGLRNAVRSAIIVTSAALSNKVSVGCHYRE